MAIKRNSAKNVHYAVRGPILERALDLQKDIEEGKNKSLKKIYFLNIGDGQATNALKPLTYFRMFLAQVINPVCLNDCPLKLKAMELTNNCRGKSIGSYSESLGIPIIRKQISEFINERDGLNNCTEDQIFLGNGASDCIEAILSLLSNDNGKNGVLIPMPQYPLYSALLSNYEFKRLDYELNEQSGWSLSIEKLEETLSKNMDTKPVAIVVVNPGNPTGGVLSKKDIENVIKFAAKHDIVIFADEVYQFNTYNDSMPFISFNKVLNEMGPSFDKVCIASFMSASKGYMAECGFRAGYCAISNFSQDFISVLKTTRSSRLSPNVVGQAYLYIMLNPPKPGEQDFEQYEKEKKSNLDLLETNARLLSSKLNNIPLIESQPINGAMYAFPKLNLPIKFKNEAETLGRLPDVHYCMELLDHTGICVIPGSGFGQAEGTYHFRTTILLNKDDLNQCLNLIKGFNQKIYEKYR